MIIQLAALTDIYSKKRHYLPYMKTTLKKDCQIKMWHELWKSMTFLNKGYLSVSIVSNSSSQLLESFKTDLFIPKRQRQFNHSKLLITSIHENPWVCLGYNTWSILVFSVIYPMTFKVSILAQIKTSIKICLEEQISMQEYRCTREK